MISHSDQAKSIIRYGIIIAIFLALGSNILYAQQPVVEIRFSNPQIDYEQSKFHVDVEFQANKPNLRLFGMNVRFYYEYGTLDFETFTGFLHGYGPVNPNPPVKSRLTSESKSLFGFHNEAVFINGAVQLVNSGAPAVYLSTSGWTKLFSLSFNIDLDQVPEVDEFKPAIVWDRVHDPAKSSFIPGSEGVVIIVVNPQAGQPTISVEEKVTHLNWQQAKSKGKKSR